MSGRRVHRAPSQGIASSYNGLSCSWHRRTKCCLMSSREGGWSAGGRKMTCVRTMHHSTPRLSPQLPTLETSNAPRLFAHPGSNKWKGLHTCPVRPDWQEGKSFSSGRGLCDSTPLCRVASCRPLRSSCRLVHAFSIGLRGEQCHSAR